MNKTGPQPLQSLLGEALPKSGKDAGASASASDLGDPAQVLPPNTMRIAQEIAARRVEQRKEDEGQHATDKGGALSAEEVRYITPSYDDEAAAIEKQAREAAARLAIIRRQQQEEMLDGQLDEKFEPDAPSALMKGVRAEQIRHGEPWDPLHVNDDWVHLPHDFVESGLMGRMGDKAFKLLMFIKTRASKETGIAVINQVEAAKKLNTSEKTVRRAMAELVGDFYVKLLDTGEPVKGHGQRYQVIERLRMFNALPVPPEKETVVDASFPYAGKKFRDVTAAARDFAKSGNIPPAQLMELTPLKSPHLNAAIKLVSGGRVPDHAAPAAHPEPTVIQNITVNVNGSVNAPINIHNAGVVQKPEPEVPEINLPDGRGNPLRFAMKAVKTRQGDDGIYEVDGN